MHRGISLYRARVFNLSDPKNEAFHNDIFEGFNEEGSLAPKPNNVDKPGRVNRINESVLYVAEDKYTALAEARTGKRQTISIAEIELLKEVDTYEFRFIDACHEDDSLEQIYHFIALEFYITVYDVKQYLITQYVARKLKGLGFGGIKYSSSLSEKGMNIAFFDTQNAKANNSKLFLTRSVLYYAERMKEENEAGRLLPVSITDKFTTEEIDYFFCRMK
ncbi:MAG: hypothetical protein APF84_14665 [Gracilibacter sp. BRH_c7a]|nr:MAG: hypothetical protein APF84_14665 [Gracilibacter sp. BRH_c7a]